MLLKNAFLTSMLNIDFAILCIISNGVRRILIQIYLRTESLGDPLCTSFATNFVPESLKRDSRIGSSQSKGTLLDLILYLIYLNVLNVVKIFLIYLDILNK